MNLEWKVCGMRDSENIPETLALKPDYMGFIFFEKSPRYVGDYHRLASDLAFGDTAKVGVFVNHSVDFIFSQVKRYGLHYIQLHGDESPDFCAALKSPILRGARDIPSEVLTIKAFGLGEDFHFETLEAYEQEVDFFLFDTKSKKYGGTGKTFNWDKLKEYPFETPFFLSGGLSLENWEDLEQFILENQNLPLQALDINSCFEISPGLKSIPSIQEFKRRIEKLKHHG